ncbi:hypothetical protein [Salisediminibacterium beveridgei]|uniref:RNA binding S1 domain protein n=1 Tax=Salisediminibacterium beveridgei TaxID=632773 RepID=A0A1D7QZ76_9BACI|nr:hypothetical protein [Salisediminibacterium beveridgei]AOM84305.1 RNA binding S1 domain protein [Salisediminibacterium beveridgei]
MGTNKKRKRQFDIEDHHPTIFLIAASCGLLSFFGPIVLIPLIQEVMLHSDQLLELLTPTLSYRMMMGALLWIPFVAGLYFITRKTAERRRVPYRLGPVMIALVLLAAPFMAFSIQHYVLLEDEGFHYNDWYEWRGTWYDWAEVEEVQPVRESRGGVLHISYRFVLEDETTFTFESDDDFRRVRSDIFDTIEEEGGTMMPTVDEEEDPSQD